MKLYFLINQNYDKRFENTKKKQQELKERYRDCAQALAYTAKEYQRSWDQIGDAFSEYIERATGYPWKHKMYQCVISPMHRGISNWDESNKIVRGWEENPLMMRRITAHELIIHHYFCIIKKYYYQEKLSDLHIWALSEIAAFALTSLTSESRIFWPWDISGYYTNHNYQSIVPLQKRLKQIFLQRKGFDEYIRKGIKMVKRYDQKIGFN